MLKSLDLEQILVGVAHPIQMESKCYVFRTDFLFPPCRQHQFSDDVPKKTVSGSLREAISGPGLFLLHTNEQKSYKGSGN